MLKEGWSYEDWLQQHQEAGFSRWSEVRPVQRLGAMA